MGRQATDMHKGRPTNYVALRALLAELDWSDASTESQDRLNARSGTLGLVINDNGSVTLVSIDPFTNDPVNVTVTGGWSYATIKNLIMHLMIIDTIRGGYAS